MAAGFEDRLTLHCKAAPEIHKNLKNDLRVYIKPHQGKVDEGRILKPGEEQAREHEIVGEYMAWKQDLKEEVDVKSRHHQAHADRQRQGDHAAETFKGRFKG